MRWPAPSMGTIASALLWITSVASCSPHWSGLVRAAEALSVVGHDAIASGLKHRRLRLMAGRQPAPRGCRSPHTERDAQEIGFADESAGKSALAFAHAATISR